MKKAIFSLTLLSVIIKVFGLVKELSLSYFFGASNITDAYIISMTIPGVVFTFIGLGITTSYIPIYMKLKENHNEETINQFTSNLINCTVMLALIIITFTIIFSKQIVSLIAFGFDDNLVELASKLTSMNIVSIIFIGCTYILTGYLQANSKFNLTMLTQVPLQIISIVFIYFAYKFSIWYLVIGNVIALAVQMTLLFRMSVKNGFRLKQTIDFKDQNILLVFRLAVPLFLGVSVNQLNTVVDKALASNIIVGGISALNYANKLNLFIYGTIVIAVTTIVFPTISKLISQDRTEQACDEVLKSVNFILFLVLPASVGAMMFSHEIVELVFMRGSFDIIAVDLTASALFFYSIGMVFTGIKEVLIRFYYASNNTKIPTFNAIIAVIINIVLNLILSKFMGISGLALATSIAAIMSTFILYLNFLKRNDLKFEIEQYIEIVKIVISTVIMGIGSRVMYISLLRTFSGNLSLVLAIFLGVISYLITAYLLGVSEMKNLKKHIIKRGT